MNERGPTASQGPSAEQKSISFLDGGGEMGRLIREHDWAATPVGTPQHWPQSLRTTVRLMLNTNHPIFIFWGQDLTCFYNDAYRATMGPERHPQSLGAGGREVWAEIWHVIGPEIDQVMSGGGATWNEQKLIPITRHGKVDNIWWTYSYSPIDEESVPGGIGGVLVICTDVTEQHNAAESMRLERERLMGLFKQAPGFIAVLYGPDHVFNIANDAYRQLAGTRDLIGLGARQAFPELADQGFFELLDRVYASGEPFIGQNVPVNLQRIPGAAPQLRYLNFIYQPIRDQHGVVTGIFVEGQDNTQSKLTEIQLGEALERNNAIIENSKDLICIFDGAGHFSNVNNRCLDILGFEPEEMLGRHYAEFLVEADAAPSARVFDSVVGGTPVADFENRYRHKDGHVVYLLWSAVWVEDQKKLFAIGKDISEWLKAQELVRRAQRSDAIGQLTGGMAHDFNNLLTVILGNAELLAEQLPAQSKHQALASMIFQASQRGALLTQRLLAFARRQPLAPKPVDIRIMLQEFTIMLGRTLGENIQIELACHEALQPALVDESQLENAILNLCLNSRDAMPKGGRLTISASNTYLDEAYARENLEVQAGNYIMISVADTGSGIAPEHLPRVFDPFFTTKDVEHGTGLGLSMVIGFAKQSKGHVTIESNQGRGTEVRLFVPQAGADNFHEPRPVTTRAIPVGGHETVLLVEDNDLVRDFAKDHLSLLGYRILSADNGQSALDIIGERADIDLLFTDIVMPGGMTGRELAERARDIRPALRVLLTSGYSGDALGQDTGVGPEEIMLRKPYTQLELAQHVRRALER